MLATTALRGAFLIRNELYWQIALYSFVCCLKYEALRDTAVFSGTLMMLLHMHVHAPPSAV